MTSIEVKSYLDKRIQLIQKKRSQEEGSKNSDNGDSWGSLIEQYIESNDDINLSSEEIGVMIEELEKKELIARQMGCQLNRKGCVASQFQALKRTDTIYGVEKDEAKEIQSLLTELGSIEIFANFLAYLECERRNIDSGINNNGLKNQPENKLHKLLEKLRAVENEFGEGKLKGKHCFIFGGADHREIQEGTVCELTIQGDIRVISDKTGIELKQIFVVGKTVFANHENINRAKTLANKRRELRQALNPKIINNHQ